MQRGYALALLEMTRQELKISSTRKLVLTVGWCKACGICMAMCPRQVLGAEPVTRAVKRIAADRCNGCGLCELVCPDYVFTLQEAQDELTHHPVASREASP